MKSIQQKMEACMNKDFITNTDMNSLPTPPSSWSIHNPTHTQTHTAVTTANPKPCHNRERVTPQSAQPLHSISDTQDKNGTPSPSQHTALHSQAITGTLERGWLSEGGRGGRADIVCPRDSTVCFFSSSGQLAAESSRGMRGGGQEEGYYQHLQCQSKNNLEGKYKA